jgi:general secretion pathway protein F
MTRFRPLPLPVRALLFQHLAAMEKAGVPPDRAYALLDLGPSARGRVQQFLKLTGRGVEPPAAGAGSGLFTVFEARLLRAAFGAGSPLATYQRLAAHLSCAASQAAALRSRMMLPVAVLAIALFVAPIPQLLLGVLTPAAYMWKVLSPLIVLAVLAAAGVRLVAWFGSGAAGPGRDLLESALLKLPLFGSLHLRCNARDFTESLALLLEAGLPLFEALPLALDTVGNRRVRRDLATILPAVKAGAPLSHAVGALRLVDTAQLSPFVHTGEESGSLPEMLMRHAAAETESLARAQADIMTWLPRVFYACVSLWMIAQLLMPKR